MHDSHNGSLLRTIHLQGWNGWVWGMHADAGLLHLIDSDGRVARFDSDTGDLLAEVTLEDLPHQHDPTGLWCAPVEEAPSDETDEH